jgi:hypothetical protein
MSAGFIRYELRNGNEYASFYIAKRVGGKKINEVEYLGKVIDKEKGVFFNRKKGTFTFTIDDGYGVAEGTYREAIQRENLILVFGDVYLLDQVLDISGLKAILTSINSINAATLLSLVAFRLLDAVFANMYANEWYEGSYASILYPNAVLAHSVLVNSSSNSAGNAFYGSFSTVTLSG